jgi:hypothetical protein
VAKWTPDRDGVYVVVATSGSNGYSLQVQTKQPFAFRTSEKQPLHVNGGLGKLYFFVPQGVDKVTLLAVAKGQAPGRGGKLKIIAPDGQVAAKLEGELASSKVSVDIPAAMQGRVWALTGADITNDLQISLAPNAVSCLGTDPTRLLQATP